MTATRARIALDAMGGDHAPDEIIAGAIRASEELDVEVLLVGDRAQIETYLKQHPASPQNLEIVDAEGVISMDEEPLTALRRKPKASINVAMELVKKNRADAQKAASARKICEWSVRLSMGLTQSVKAYW